MNNFHGGPQCLGESLSVVDGGMVGRIPPSVSRTMSSAFSRRALEELWPVYVEEVRTRLVGGIETYGDGSFGRTPYELCEEVSQEQLDVMGWNFILWVRQRRLGEVLRISEELIDFVVEKYGVKSLDEFTCPIHRRLAVALGKFSERNGPAGEL